MNIARFTVNARDTQIDYCEGFALKLIGSPFVLREVYSFIHHKDPYSLGIPLCLCGVKYFIPSTNQRFINLLYDCSELV